MMNDLKLKKFHIEGPDENNNSVKIWSIMRFPYNIKKEDHELNSMRNDLKVAIKNLKSENNTLFNGIYCSTQTGFFDVENVLFYNLKCTKCYKHLCGKGLRFELRIVQPPETPIKLIKEAKHHNHYSLVSYDNFWEDDLCLAEWTNIPLTPLKGKIEPHSVWYDMKKGSIEKRNNVTHVQFYGIQVIINAPLGTKSGLHSYAKPLLDGIISSFHNHDGTDIEKVTNLLANKLDKKESIIKDMLDYQPNFLIKKNLFANRSNPIIQWKPDDHAFIKGEILFDNSMKDSSWSLSGKLYKIGK